MYNSNKIFIYLKCIIIYGDVMSTETTLRLSLTPYEVREHIIKSYFASPTTTLMLLGAPGIGKTETVIRAGEIIAQKLGKKFVFFEISPTKGGGITLEEFQKILAKRDEYFVVVKLPLEKMPAEDLIGYPRVKKIKLNGFEYEVMDYIPPLWALIVSSGSGILFVDDYTNVKEFKKISAMYDITLERRIGYLKISDEVLIICAGNKPEHVGGIASELPSAQIDRLEVIEVATPSVDDWATYMEERHSGKWSKLTLAYLYRFRSHLYVPPDKPETLENFPTPRSWTKVALKIHGYEDDFDFVKTVSVGLLGQQVGLEFANFVRIKAELPEPKQLLEHPEIFLNLDLEKKYLASVMIGGYIKELLEKDIKGDRRTISNELKKVLNYLEFIAKKSTKEFIVLTILSIGDRATVSRIVARLLRAELILRKRGERTLTETLSKITTFKKIIRKSFEGDS